ncbi:unnamed protein product, partial [Prorocentrum cordatum]
MEWSPEIAARDTNGMITQWLESWLCPRCGARCAVDTIAPQSGQQMCARCLEQGTWTAEASTAEGEWRCALCEPDAWTREARTNSAVYVPLLLAAAGLLDPSEGAQWSEHRLTQAWWQPTVETLRLAEPVLTGPFVQMLAYTDARPGEVPAVLAADGGERPGHVSFAPVAQAVAHSSTGYIQPLVQDLLLEAFGGGVLARGVDARTNELRNPSFWADAAPPPPLPPPEAPQEPELPGDQHANGPAAEGANDGGSNSSTEETDHEAEPAQAPAPSNGPTEESWAALGGIDLQQELRRFVPTLQNVPRFLRAETRMAFTTALQRIKRGHDQGNQATTHQGWTLFLLASRLLLSKPKGTDAEGRQELLERAQRFRQGDWLALLHEANTTAGARAAPRPATEEQQQERRREQACAHVRNGNPSRGRQVLTAAAIAPGNGETLNRLRDPARRPPTLSRRLPANLDRATDRARLDKTKFLACLRSAKKGTAAGPSGVRVEHLKPLLEHEESMDLLGFAAAALAEARVPSPIARALALCKMTLEQGDFLVAFLDDVYIKTTRARARAAFDTTTGAIHLHANVDCHLGKCRAYSRGGDLLDGTRPGRRGNLAAAAAAAQLLETEGFRRPSWTDLLQGLRPEAPPRSEAAEPGEWQHGWQFHACSARNTHYRDNVFMPSLTRANQAMLRSGSGPRAAYWLHTLPTTEGHVFKPARFLAALRRRLRLPLPLLPHTCGAAGHPGCRARLDTLGDHLAACPRTGLLARRAKPLERAWARVAREAGGRVVPQQLLRDTNAVVHNPLDRRQLDLVVYGISPNGVPLCCDSTMVSPLRRDGWHRPRTFDTDGAALLGAERRKRRRYHELTTGHSGRLMVLSCEVGGRWGRDSLQLVRLLAKQKARAAPALLHRSAELAYTNRWWGFLSVAAQDSLMATLTGDGYLALGGAAGEDDPDLAEVLLAAGRAGGRCGRGPPGWGSSGGLRGRPCPGTERSRPGQGLERSRGSEAEARRAARPGGRRGGGGWRREDRAVAGGPAGPPKATAGVGSPARGPAGGSQVVEDFIALSDHKLVLLDAPCLVEPHLAAGFGRVAWTSGAEWEASLSEVAPTLAALAHAVELLLESQWLRPAWHGGAAERFLSGFFKDADRFDIQLVSPVTGRTQSTSEMLDAIQADLLGRAQNDFPQCPVERDRMSRVVSGIRRAGAASGPERAQPLYSETEVEEAIALLKLGKRTVHLCNAAVKAPVQEGFRLTRALLNLGRRLCVTSRFWSLRQFSPLRKSGPPVVRKVSALRPVSFASDMASVQDALWIARNGALIEAYCDLPVQEFKSSVAGILEQAAPLAASAEERLRGVFQRLPVEADRVALAEATGSFHLPPVQFVDDITTPCPSEGAVRAVISDESTSACSRYAFRMKSLFTYERDKTCVLPLLGAPIPGRPGCPVVSQKHLLGVLVDSGLTFGPLLNELCAIGDSCFKKLLFAAESGGFSVPVAAAQVPPRVEAAVLFACPLLAGVPGAEARFNKLQVGWGRRLLGCHGGPPIKHVVVVAQCGWRMRMGTRFIERALMARARLTVLPPDHPGAIMYRASRALCVPTWLSDAAALASRLPDPPPDLDSHPLFPPEALRAAQLDPARRKVLLREYRRFALRPALLRYDQQAFAAGASRVLPSLNRSFAALCPGPALPDEGMLTWEPGPSFWRYYRLWAVARMTGAWPLPVL